LSLDAECGVVSDPFLSFPHRGREREIGERPVTGLVHC